MLGPPLARLAGREPATGPRIAVIGNCQSYGVAYAMKLLDPSATVDHYSALGRPKVSVNFIARTLARYDHVFSHALPPGHLKDGLDELRARAGNLVMFPAITFQAFHPDLVYLFDETDVHSHLNGPMGPYHSALGVFAFHKGLSVDEALGLFDRDVFEAVGYLGVWDSAARELLAYAKENFDIDLSFELLSWSRRGVFMYSTVHPKGFVLFDMAKKVFAKAGLRVRELDFEYYAIHDLARSEIFPIYPPVAELFGVPGSYVFKAQNHHISAGVGRFLNLPRYLSECYKIYQKNKPSRMRHARIDNWLSDDRLSDMLTRRARENARAGRMSAL